ncbi:hypothetical protein ACVMFA_001135 [Bradyrhizobium liaoningense]
MEISVWLDTTTLSRIDRLPPRSALASIGSTAFEIFMRRRDHSMMPSESPPSAGAISAANGLTLS